MLKAFLGITLMFVGFLAAYGMLYGICLTLVALDRIAH